MMGLPRLVAWLMSTQWWRCSVLLIVLGAQALSFVRMEDSNSATNHQNGSPAVDKLYTADLRRSCGSDTPHHCV